MLPKHSRRPPPEVASEVVARPAFVGPSFEQVYAETFSAVWRLVRQMGVVETSVDDVLQDVFVVVHRRLHEFTGTSALKSWVLGISVRVVGNYRRARKRKGAGQALGSAVTDPESIESTADDQHEHLRRAEAARIVQRVLNQMNPDKAALFVLAELEGLTAPEIAEAFRANVNTTYARLRAARRDFERGLARLKLGQL